jgi:16S rRNA (cytosine1402-N4)-methyltransferase
MEFKHTSVLLEESIEALNLKEGGCYVDGTLGRGGHSYEILRRSPKGLLLGIDRDPAALKAAQATLEPFKGRFKLFNTTYDALPTIVYDSGLTTINGILLDLGVSSYQLSDTSRGFSFQSDGPLDMRMGAGDVTAADIVNTYSAPQLQQIFSEYAQERYAKTVAQAIVKAREEQPFTTSGQLAKVVEAVYARYRSRSKIHPATKVFQALRIEVNQEIDILKKALEASLKLLAPGGRIVVITFHSLEDKVVKEFFKDYGMKGKVNKYGSDDRQGELLVITKKPIVPTASEVKRNPRARSAKLRVAEKI